jgi:hypothetical protein
MPNLQKVLKDGTETGSSVADKINAIIDEYLFEYDKNSNVEIPSTAFVELANIPITLKEGVYMVGFSIQWKLNLRTKSPIIKWSLDDGVTWNKAQNEPKDATDINLTTYQYPIEVPNGTSLVLRLQMAKETNSGECKVFFSDMWIQKVR